MSLWSGRSPGDDGTTGTASRYEVRRSESPITEGNWEAADCVDTTCVPDPKPAGQIETIVVRYLVSATRYYFALKTADEAGNESDLSNCATECTLNEAFPPASVTDLVATAVSDTQFELTWTAPGDDHMNGTADRYDIRFSSDLIADDSAWNTATPVGAIPSPKPASEKESFVVTVNFPNTSFFFALKTADESDNWSGLSNPAPGLGIGLKLLVAPLEVHEGERVVIAFRAAPTGPTHVSVNEGLWVNQCCGPTAVKCLASGTYAPGVYTATFDFCDDTPGECPSYGWYGVYLCWNGPVAIQYYVKFEP